MTPVTLLSPRIGLDIGGTKIEAIVLNPRGEVEARAVVRTIPGPGAVLSSAAELVATLVAESGRRFSEFAGVGIGIPGQVDREHGIVRNAFNMGISSLGARP